MFRAFESHVFPRLTPIYGFIYAITIGHTSLIIVLTCSNPNHIRIIGIHGDATNRITARLIKNRNISGPCIHRFPNAP